MVIVETEDYRPIPAPAGYDPRNYRDHAYPKDPLWLYPTRRIIDRYGFDTVTHPDVLLLCFPAFDYPTDIWPAAVAEALEETEPGASKKNIAELTRAQRQIVYNDAKRYSLGFLHYLQTEVHDAMEDTTHSFRRFKLSEEFGTADNLPPKPYLRESLRTKAMYMTRQQDTTGFDNYAGNFAQVMFHDTVLAWQFEYDFHPTGRRFLDDDPAGPWQNYFREGRTWGPPYSGRSTFPLRSLIPEKMDGLIVAQKNLGYTSLVGSALRLHDQSMAVGQAAGAAAAVALIEDVEPRTLPYDRARLTRIQEALAAPARGTPAVLWPFADLAPDHPAYPAANMLAVQSALSLAPDEVHFEPDASASREWGKAVIKNSLAIREVEDPPAPPDGDLTRAEFVVAWWDRIRDLPLKPFERLAPDDADGDGIPDHGDALLFSAQETSWPDAKLAADKDGLPEESLDGVVHRINFAGPDVSAPDGWAQDNGAVYDPARGYGWTASLESNHRWRGRFPEVIRDTFLFTRSHHTWECDLPNGDYDVTLSIGDAAHEQTDQNVAVEGQYVIEHHDTPTGRYQERSAPVTIEDGKLTLEIGRPGSASNTCLNWLIIRKP
jgi:hypothetical protein